MNVIKLSLSIFGTITLLLALNGCTPGDVCKKLVCSAGFSKKEVNGLCTCVKDNPTTSTVIKSGFIKADETWSADKIYVLNGKVIVNKNVTLTIQPGTIIKAQEGTGTLASALLVAQDGKLNACGTATSPIIMTSISDNIKVGEKAGSNLDENQRGLWGGLIVLGKAPGSFKGDVGNFQIEGIPADESFGRYGGTDPTDNSGSLCYISIRHGGASIGNNNEINGLTLGGVGTGTKIDHIEVVGNLDDGIEFFGGTVNVSNALVWAQGDDAFDVDQAYSGTLKNFVYIAGRSSDHGLEIDGPEGSANGRFTFKNGTLKLISDNNASKGVEIADFRDNAQGALMDCLILNLSDKSDIEIADKRSMQNYLSDGLLTITGLEFATTKLVENLCAYSYYKQLEEKEQKGEKVDEADKAKAKKDDADFDKKMTENNKSEKTPTKGADKSVFSWTLAAQKGALNF